MKYSPATLLRRAQMALAAVKVIMVNDALDVQSHQLQLDGQAVRDETPTVYFYGFSSNPLPGAAAIMLTIGGDRKQAVVIATTDLRYRPKNLPAGATAIHDTKTLMVMTNDGNVSLTMPEGGVLTIAGDVRVTGNVTAGYDTGDQVDLQNHVHSGVMAGGADTGPPVAGS